MNSLKELFKTEKPIIALLHIRALPGDPFYTPDCTMDEVVALARHELLALQAGGVDAVLFSNEFSMPYQHKVNHVITAAMARVIAEVKGDIKVPFGVHVISDGEATIELAAAVDAKFVRSVFTGAYVGETGFRSTDIAKTLRRKSELGLRNLKMFYMINAEADGDISERDLSVIAQAVIFKCAPDGLCISGIHAGHGVDSSLIRDIRKASNKTPVLCNTGCKTENIAEKLTYADGAFVGTSFKFDGLFENLVDSERVKTFMDEVKKFRKDN